MEKILKIKKKPSEIEEYTISFLGNRKESLFEKDPGLSGEKAAEKTLEKV